MPEKVDIFKYLGTTLTRDKKNEREVSSNFLTKVKEVTWMDRIRNDDVGQELEVKAVIKRIEDNQLKWFSHISKVANERPAKMVWVKVII